jgi:hypothetical protein
MVALGRARAVASGCLLLAAAACDRAELDLLPAHAAANAFDAALVDHAAPAPRTDGGHSFPSGGAQFVCTSDDQCGGRRFRRCDIRSGRCVECTMQSDCAPPTVCDVFTERCAIPCQTGDDCLTTAQTRCDPNRHVCVGCTSSDQCVSPTRFCEPTYGQCVECLDSRQCEPWFCSPFRNECVECLDNQHCPPGEACVGGQCTTR